MIVPLFVGREKSISALEVAMKQEKGIFLVAQKSAQKDDPMEQDIYSVGTIGVIIQLLRLPDGTVKVLVEGKERGRIKQYLSAESYFAVEVEEMPDELVEDALKLKALMRSVKESFEQYVKLSRKINVEVMGTVSAIDEPSKLADVIISHLTVKVEDKQRILEKAKVGERLESVYEMLLGEIEILQVEEKIRRRVKSRWRRTRRITILMSRCGQSRRRWGKDEFKSEIAELEKRLKQKKLSEEAYKKVKSELKKLQLMPPMSAEATVVRNYIDWILDLPWSERTENKYSLKESEAILEEDHYGLKQVKERILEYLAVQGLVAKNKGSILCLVGPPGVGKTSIAKSLPALPTVNLYAFPWVAYGMRQKFGDTGGHTSGRYQGRSFSS